MLEGKSWSSTVSTAIRLKRRDTAIFSMKTVSSTPRMISVDLTKIKSNKKSETILTYPTILKK